MSTRTPFWLDIRRAALQWAGIALASVISGLLLGFLSYDGISNTFALEIAVPVGFLLALLFWVSIAYWFAVNNTQIISVSASWNVPNFEGAPTISVYSYQCGTLPNTMASQSSAA